MTATCRSCHAPIWWLVTEAGKRMPVNPTPDPSGNLAVKGCGFLGFRVLKADEDLAAGETRHVSHFATCPSADKHRSSR